LTIAVGLAIALLLVLALAESDAPVPGESCQPIGASAAGKKGEQLICSEFTRFNPASDQFERTGRGFWRIP